MKTEHILKTLDLIYIITYDKHKIIFLFTLIDHVKTKHIIENIHRKQKNILNKNNIKKGIWCITFNC